MSLDNLPLYEQVSLGEILPSQTFRIDNADLERYAAASGDFNPIHLDRQAALEAGLPDVIAHGMFIMELACRVVTDWCGDPGAIADYSTRFIRPIIVASDHATEIQVDGNIKEKLAGKQVLIDLSVKSNEVRVFGIARIAIKLR